MSANVFPNFASGLTNGLPLKITATATPGNTIHSVPSNAGGPDQVALYATNLDTVDRTLTVEWGDATAPDHNVTMTIQAGAGPILVVPNWPLQIGYTVKAFASAANVINVFATITQFRDHRGN